MNFKMILLASAAALMMGACAHKSHHACGGCASKEAKKECSGSECPVDKKCDSCAKSEASSK